MKINFLKFGFYAIMLSMGVFMTACGNAEEGHDHDHGQHQHQHEDGEHDHDQEGHQHEDGEHQHEQGQEHEGEESSSIDKTGKEYTSAYICPMHCEGSGSDKEGSCPKCKMAYVENPDK